MEKEGKPAVEVVLTVLHAGGKFGDGGGYKVSGGLHGVGVSVVNALSERLDVEVRRDGFTSGRQDYERGVAAGRRCEQGEPTSETGTTITFLPDAEIFETLDFDFATLEQRLRETAFLTRGLRISIDRRARRGPAGPSSSTRAASRTSSRYLNENKDPIQQKVIFFEGEGDEGAVEVAMQWNSSYQESVFSFANNINTHEGGSHLSGFRSALTRTLNRYAREKGELKEKDENLAGEDVREGLTAVISVKLTDPQFEGQTKTKLGNPGMEGFVAVGRQREARRVPRGEPAGGATRSSARRSRPPRRAPPRARRATSRAASPRSRTRRCRASSPTARSRTRRWPSCSSSRATPPAARPSRAATADAGGPAAARQDPQRREGADRQGAAEQRDPGADHGARHRRPRRVRHREGCATTRSS